MPVTKHTWKYLCRMRVCTQEHTKSSPVKKKPCHRGALELFTNTISCL